MFKIFVTFLVLFVPKILCNVYFCRRDEITVNCSMVITKSQITTVPKELLNSTITTIDLRYQPLKPLSGKVFAEAYNLRTIYLTNCGLRLIDKDAFENLTRLEYLYIDSNRLSILDVGLFRNNWNLKSLYASRNRINILENGMFSNLTKLRILSLHQNRIKHIDNKIFADNKNLEQITLSFNQLSHLDGDMFSNLKYLNKLYVHNNLWHCDCNLISFYNVTLRMEMEYYPKCRTPIVLSNRNWTQLKIEDFDCPHITISRSINNATKQKTLICHIESNSYIIANWYYADQMQMSVRKHTNNTNMYIFETYIRNDTANNSNNTYTCVVTELRTLSNYSRSITIGNNNESTPTYSENENIALLITKIIFYISVVIFITTASAAVWFWKCHGRKEDVQPQPDTIEMSNRNNETIQSDSTELASRNNGNNQQDSIEFTSNSPEYVNIYSSPKNLYEEIVIH